MKYLILALFCAFLAGSSVLAAEDAKAPNIPIKCWIIRDTSSSTGNVSEELDAIVKNFVYALKPGDAVRGIATTGSRPRLILLDRITQDEPARAEIVRTLQGISSVWLRKADVASAMEIPLSTIKQEEKDRLYAAELVLVLSDAELGSDRADAVIAAAERLKAAGALVILTGVEEAANRKFLIEATRTTLKFQDLNRCDPAAWIQTARESASRRSSAAPLSKESPVPAATKETTSKHLNKAEQEGGQAPIPTAGSSPNNAGQHAAKVPQAGVSPDQSPTTYIISIRPSGTGQASPILPVPFPSESAPAGQVRSPEPSGSLQVKAAKSPEAVAQEEPSALTPTTPQPSAKGITPPQMVKASPQLPAKAPPVASGSEPAPLLKSLKAVPQALGHWVRNHWLVCLIALAGLVMCILLLKDLSRALRERSGMDDGSSDSGSTPQELVASFGGVEHSLGEIGRTNNIHIGSGPSSTLRVTGKDVEDRHVEIRCGKILKLKNLSREKPVEANGAIIPPRASAQIDLPAVLRLGETVSVNLFQRPIADPEVAITAAHSS